LDRLEECIAHLFPWLSPHWAEVAPWFGHTRLPAKTVLLREGDVARSIFFILQGCVRAYAIRDDGREVTIQFFFEGGMVASLESFLTGKASRVCLETLEETEVLVLPKGRMAPVMAVTDPSGEGFVSMLKRRLIYYMDLHTSFVIDSPESRYRRLLAEAPEVVSRVPQHYIATYLGITPVSLSRIRARLRRKAALTKDNDRESQSR
jgi:CRP-like cAMP-binding protein